MNKSDRHLPALDGVRGLAVLIVVAYHVGGGARSSNHLVRLLGDLIQTGWIGVSLFFILSGFLITGILWDTREAPNRLKGFYMRRTLRIFPLYYGTLLVVFLSAVIYHHGMYCLSKIWIFFLYLQNIPALDSRISDLGSPLKLYHFWSLAVEEQFYLVWPFLLLRMRTIKDARNLCAAVIFISLAFRVVLCGFEPSAVSYEFILARAGELAAGGFLAICYRDGSWQRLESLALPTFIVSLAVFAPFAKQYRTSVTTLFEIGIPCITLVWASFLVLSLKRGGFVHSMMSADWLRWFGKISYGVYVFHVLLASWYARLVSLIFPHVGRTEAVVLTGIINVTLSAALAVLSFRYFESPFLSLRTRFKSVAGRETQTIAGSVTQLSSDPTSA